MAPVWTRISTTSPSPSPSFTAVLGLISIQLLHIADVIGSGISCSHGRCASEPSKNVLDGYGRKWKIFARLAVEPRFLIRLCDSRRID